MKSRYQRLLLMLGAALLAVMPVFAQDATPTTRDTHPLLEMLALVPDIPAGQAGVPVISYVDYRAMEMAWPESPTYENWTEWNTASESDDFAARIWFANFMRLNSGPTFWRYLKTANETPDLLGFDIFDIDCALLFGKPPAVGQIYAGEFDAQAIITATTANEYKATETEGVTLLQRADGESGSKMDLASRNLANIFGGELGLKEPFAVLPTGYLVNSRDDALLESMIEAQTGSQSNLGEQPSYQAAAHAVTEGDGLLIQALFFSILDVGVLPGLLPEAILSMDPTQVAEALESRPVDQRDYGTLPAYNLAVMADRQEGDEQVVLIALVYNDPASAEAGAAELTKRLASFSNAIILKRDTPLIDAIEGASMSEPRVYTDENGLSVALAEARYPMPEPILVNMLGEPAKEGEAGSTVAAPGILFRQWVNAIYQRSFSPLGFLE